jgi:plastocyanin
MRCLLIFLLCFLSGCDATTSTDSTSTTTTTVTTTPTPTSTEQVVVNILIPDGGSELGTQGFGAYPVTLNPGTEVIWTNGDSVEHDFADDFNHFFCQMKPGTTCSYTFTISGTYDYSDLFYDTMLGRIIVTNPNI